MNSIGRRLGMTRTAICGVLVAALSCACTNLASGNDRLEQPVEAAGGPPSGGWDCLTNPPTDLLKPLDPAPPGILYVVPIFDLAHAPQRIPNLSIQVCQAMDGDCTQPLAAWDSKNQQTSGKILINDVTMSDGIPLYSFLFPYAPVTFYLHLTSLPAAPMQPSSYLQFEYYFEGPLIRGNAPDTMLPATASTPAVAVPTLVGLPITMLSFADAVRFGKDIQITLEPTAAIVAPRIIDCDGQLAKDVLLTTTAEGAIGFTFGNGLAARGMANAPPLTSVSGIAGFYVPLPLPGLPSQSPNIILEGISPAPANVPYGRIFTKIRGGQLTSGEIRPYSDQSGR